ncbi:MAG: rhomboid family intramembrane serine protease [Rikenellaceae bacterium]|nr:rhomboid family intramembrane serine protease [Rikenellaceae bacterium]
MRATSQFSTPPVVKNLLIINALFFLAVYALPDNAKIWLYANLSLFPIGSRLFMPHQLVSYMFMHAGFEHFFFNMFALWMFGRVLEYDLGSRRFLIFYMACGVGAGLIQLAVNMMVPAGPTVGASGAIFGILLGFGMLHPNSIIMLLIPPIPMKAKYFVIIYGALELWLGVSGRMDNIAHFAHLGGMVWGFLLLWWWKKKGKLYY